MPFSPLWVGRLIQDYLAVAAEDIKLVGKNKEKSLWGTVSVAFETSAGNEVELTAVKPITTPLGQDTPWTRFKGNLIVLGLAFLKDTSMTIDIEDGKVQFLIT